MATIESQSSRSVGVAVTGSRVDAIRNAVMPPSSRLIFFLPEELVSQKLEPFSPNNDGRSGKIEEDHGCV